MNFYERYCMPRLVDAACGMPAISKQRSKIVPRAQGRVLEIGFGSGRNLPHYGDQVSELLALDPHAGFTNIADKRAANLSFPLSPLAMSGEHIDLDAASIDCVVMTYTLCSVDEPLAVMDEIRRVLKPRGELLFCEHAQAPDAAVRKWQDRLNPAWRKIAGNCHMNRDVAGLLTNSGWRSDDQQQAYIPGPKILTWNVWGSAKAL